MADATSASLHLAYPNPRYILDVIECGSFAAKGSGRMDIDPKGRQ